LVAKLGKSPEIYNVLVEKLFEAYHEIENDISEINVLRDIAIHVGFHETEVDEWLESDLSAALVTEEAGKS
jgi:predicted DsbA family dithiol-disulfide isomerase